MNNMFLPEQQKSRISASRNRYRTAGQRLHRLLSKFSILIIPPGQITRQINAYSHTVRQRASSARAPFTRFYIPDSFCRNKLVKQSRRRSTHTRYSVAFSAHRAFGIPQQDDQELFVGASCPDRVSRAITSIASCPQRWPQH